MLISRSFTWDAGHRCCGLKKCGSLHGHRYKAEIFLADARSSSNALKEKGFILDLAIVKKRIQGWINANWDHTMLLNAATRNEDTAVIEKLNAQVGRKVYWLKRGEPTSENVCLELSMIAQQLLHDLPVRVVRIRFWETPNISSEWVAPSSVHNCSNTHENATVLYSKEKAKENEHHHYQDENGSVSSSNRSQMETMEDATRMLLQGIDEDINRPGLRETPKRVARAWKELTRGYTMDIKSVLNGALFKCETRNGMVVVRDIQVQSMCEHHLLPFFGVAHVAYIPGQYVLGISKFARIVSMFSRRLQVQERLTNEIADTIMKVIRCHGVAVYIECRHLCMLIRGVRSSHSSTVTSSFRGNFETDADLRKQFLSSISQGRGHSSL